MGLISMADAEKLCLEQLYEFGADSAVHNALTGKMPYIEWLRLEENRINKNPLRRAAVVRRAENSNDVALFVNPAVLGEFMAYALGYARLSDWSTCDEALDDLGYVEPRKLVKNKCERATADGHRVVIVRHRNGKMFAVFNRGKEKVAAE